MNQILKEMFLLEQTCTACPEQYDVFLKATGELVGYMRLRHGWFYTSAPLNRNAGGTIVYESYPRGDGSFEDNEREMYLENGLQAIKDWLETPAEDELGDCDPPCSEDSIGL